VVAAAGKRQKSGGGGPASPPSPPSLPPSVRAEGELSDRERALLEAAVRDSQQSQQQQQKHQPKAAKKGFAASALAPAAAAAPTAPAARPIDPREAARGRVELVNVRNWGSGDAGDLEVVSMRTLVGGGQGEQEQQQQKKNNKPAGGATPAPPPFTAALAQQLQLAEARGALSIASSSASKPLPPFEQWSFSPRSYAQYLADHAEAHAALDEAVDAVVVAAEAAATGGEATTPAQKAARCLRWFARQRGIARGDAYASDLRAMVASMQEAEEPPAPSNGAAALARLLRRLGRDAASSDNSDGGEAALKLAAHAYALRAAHLSGSGRITAAAEGRLGLAKRGALAAVARYEGEAASGGAPPPAAFSADVDAFGREMMDMAMSATDDEPYAWARPLFAEMPSAFRKASALLDGLATTAGG
jgi:hypothetical protein